LLYLGDFINFKKKKKKKKIYDFQKHFPL